MTAVLPDVRLPAFAAARQVHVVYCGEDESAVPLAAFAGMRLHRQRVRVAADGACLPSDLTKLSRRLERETVGGRFVVVGPELAAYQVRSVLREAGAIEEEVAMHITSDRGRRVFCAHCHVASPSQARVGDTVSCPGCGRLLVIDRHFSRHHAAYLGYQVDAEEPQ